MSLASLRPRDLLLVGYHGDDWSHQRVLLKRVSRDSAKWVVVTPHHDLYIEDLTEYVYWHKLGVRGGFLPGTDRALYERMVAFQTGDIRDNIDEWLQEAAQVEAERADAVPGNQLAAADGRAAAGAMPAAGVPVVLALEVRYGYNVGSPVDVSTGALHMFGDRGVLELYGSGSIAVGLEGTLRDADVFGGQDDLRTLPVTYDSDKQRSRAMDAAANVLTESVFDDWPVPGPRTTKWLVRSHTSTSTTFRRRDVWWRSTMDLSNATEGVEEHGLLAEIFETAICYDQLNVSELACFELLARRFQLWEHSFAHQLRKAQETRSSSTLEVDERSIFLGRNKSSDVALVSPLLQAHIADTLKDSSAILKERRKYREEFDESGAGAGGGGGGGGRNQRDRRDKKAKAKAAAAAGEKKD